jgi:hypothetical protein
MSKYRRAAKVDGNQGQIVKALRAIPGVTVATRHDDILVGYRGRTYWYELKKSVKAEVKPGQAMLKAEWRGHYAIVSTFEDILAEITGIRSKTGASMPRLCLPRPADGLLRAVGAAAEGDGAAVRAEEGKAVKG